MSHTRRRCFGAAVLLGALGVLLFGAGPAAADSVLCEAGAEAGQCTNPEQIAVDFENGRLYVADRGNNRVDVFDQSGAFLFAFGYGVDTGAEALEKCTTASTCQKGIAGSKRGQLSSSIHSIAIDNDSTSPSHHAVWVGDTGNRRVQKFDSEGNFLLTFGGEVNESTGEDVCAPPDSCKAGVNGTGAGQISVPNLGTAFRLGVAEGIVQVVDTSGKESEGFTTRFKRYDEEGEQLSVKVLREGVNALVRALSAESDGEFFVYYERSEGGLVKYDTDGEGIECRYGAGEGCAEANIATNTLAVDEGDDLYAMQLDGGGLAITRYDPVGAILRRWGYGQFPFATVSGLAAPDPLTGDVFTSQSSAGVRFLEEPPPGPLVVPDSVEVVDVGNSSATVRAQINPEGETTEYVFQYVSQQAYEEQGESFVGPATRTSPPLDLAPSFDLQPAEGLAGCPDPAEEASEPETLCLSPETEYRFRVTAKNPSNPEGTGPARAEGPPFETLEPFEIVSVFASEAGSDSARINAAVNPLGIPASGYFEYVDEATYQESGFAEAIKVPNVDEGAGEISFGAGSEPLARGASLELEPNTAYRYRVQVTDVLIEGHRASAERSLSTYATPVTETGCANDAFRGGAAAILPDCRGYELVSPLDKEGGDVVPLKELGRLLPAALDQSSVDGNRLAYGAYRAFADAEAAPFTSQYIAARGPEGWSSHYILGSREELDLPVTSSTGSELKALSLDLCEGWSRTVAEPSLATGALEGFPNLYRRADQLCGEEGWEALTTTEPENGSKGGLELQGVSADGQTSIYTAFDNLVGTEAPDLGGAALTLYHREAGEEPHYVCILPDEEPLEGPCAAGMRNGNAGNARRSNSFRALAEDGQSVYWTAMTTGFEGPGKIYLRLNPSEPQSAIVGGECTEADKACTLAVSEEAEGIEGSSQSSYWAAAADGSAAIFETGGTLYRYEAATKETTEVAGESFGVMGASADLARVYAASGEALAVGPNPEGENPVGGERNLYLFEAGSEARFVGTLDARDFTEKLAPIASDPSRRISRVSEDGATAAFTSTASLTGFDNTDVTSARNCGEEGAICDAEVFLYDAEANGGEGELLCASCDPTDARPAGQDIQTDAGEYFAAAWIPFWSTVLYAPRSLAADGKRLYFNAAAALSPLDSNGAPDVYQWERVGSGGCEESDPDHHAANGGCVSLISSGQSAKGAGLLDASPSGEDVFFSTLASLVSEDYGLVDIYDARVGGGFPSPPPPPPECEGESCQNPAPAPADAPRGSLGYHGPGDLAPPKAKKKSAKKKRCAKGKRRVRRGGRVRCVKRKAKRSSGRHARRAGRARR